jgi:hypothetical protein
MKTKPISATFGWPGMEHRWTRGCKDGVETAYAASSDLVYLFGTASSPKFITQQWIDRNYATLNI